jgi:hypothetical protein
MGKKGADGGSGDGSSEGEMEALKQRMQKMEDLFQEQSKEFKAEVALSHQSMNMEFRKQMDELFARLMKVQTSTPPPQPFSVESMASNMAHAIDQTTTLGDTSVSMPMFKLSASPQSQIALPRPNTSTSSRPTTQQKPSFPPQTPPTTQYTRTFTPSTTLHPPDTTQYGMPTFLWPLTSSTSITLQPLLPQQFTPTLTSYPQISAVNTFSQTSKPYYPYTQNPPPTT